MLSQTSLPREIILLDDLSEDGTYEFVKAYEHPALGSIKFLVEQNSCRLGSIKSFERALMLATSEWVAFADQDDYWRKEKLETLFAWKSTASLVFSDALLMDQDDVLLGRTLWQDLKFDSEKRRVFTDNPIEVLKTGFYVTGAAMMVVREKALSCVPFPKKIHHDAWIAWNLALRGCNLRPVDDCLWHYRLHASQQVGVGLSKNPISRIRRFFSREDQFLHKLIGSFGELLAADGLNDHSLEKKYITEKMSHLHNRLNRKDICWRVLFEDFKNGRYAEHSLGVRSFLKDLIVNRIYSFMD